ncbi:MAG TPA: SRPBCC domain-containing protein [Longimicrobiales bacterium]|nr:SRPBCC domain-containing protein [Longimicrobiales bacterium]
MTPRTDRAARAIRASPAALYRAFAHPGAMEAWLPPEGMTGRMLAFDFRDGGSYRMRLTYDDPGHPPGKSSDDADEVEVRFLELIPDRSIVQAVTFDSPDPRFAGVMTMIWTFVPGPSGTGVTVRCDDVPEGIRREDHEAALASTLENLARFTE